MKCIKCAEPTDITFPLTINGEIQDGGCTGCWEDECADLFWDTVDALSAFEQGVKNER